jgi:hypothetical protein
MLTGAGFRPAGGLMPVQTLDFGPEKEAGAVHAGLTRAGIRALVAPEPVLSGGRIIFVITAKHQPVDVERAALALKRILPPTGRLSSAKEYNAGQPGTVWGRHGWTGFWGRSPGLPLITAP